MKPSHLYIHIPFCASRCSYCDFYSTAGRLRDADDYVGALLAELEWAQTGRDDPVPGRLETVYLGGGTPTLLGPRRLELLMAALRPCLAAGAEVTVEANPATVTAALASALRQMGVTRVSLGAQSFQPRLRQRLGRRGPVELIADAVGHLRRAGFQEIALDLIFGIPGQDPAELEDDLRRALALEPVHLSCYELTVHEGSDYERRWLEELRAARERGRMFYETVAGRLEAAGFEWYETSSFAQPGHQCRHNLAYWKGSDYVGLGAGAWSTAGARRWRNVEDVSAYIAAARTGGWESIRAVEELAQRDKQLERLALGLRRAAGVEAAAVAPVIDGAQAKQLQAGGFIALEGDKIRLTRAGRFVANEVCARLIADG